MIYAGCFTDATTFYASNRPIQLQDELNLQLFCFATYALVIVWLFIETWNPPSHVQCYNSKSRIGRSQKEYFNPVGVKGSTSLLCHHNSDETQALFEQNRRIDKMVAHKEDLMLQLHQRNKFVSQKCQTATYKPDSIQGKFPDTNLQQ